jgi:hypothetical protein
MKHRELVGLTVNIKKVNLSIYYCQQFLDIKSGLKSLHCNLEVKASYVILILSFLIHLKGITFLQPIK